MRRSVLLVLTTCLLSGCVLLSPAAAPESVYFLVRHAEKGSQPADPPLTEAGARRAARLAVILRDCGIDTIYSSDFSRTRDTAAPLAQKLGLKVRLYDPADLARFAGSLGASPSRSFIVGHSNTTPDLVRLLGGDPGPAISDDEYDRLYILVRREGLPTSTVLLRF